MKTLYQNPLKIFVFIIAAFFAIALNAQVSSEKDFEIIHLDTLSVVSNQQEFKNMVSKIVSNGNFRYRKTLRHSKAVNKQYKFSNVSISEVQILKHFKKAARRSESAEEFISYFQDRNLNFLDMLDGYAISSLYNTVRQTTFNGYMDDWQSYH
ncbi:MAG: hypothetical protein V7767_06555 [Leeuwenhoekiella sp.]